MSSTWIFRMCGRYQSFEIPIPTQSDEDVIIIDENTPEILRLRGALITRFGIEADAKITFHLEEETCSTQRPLQELLTMQPNIGDSTLQIHLQRQPTLAGSFRNSTFRARLSFSTHEESDAEIDTREAWRTAEVIMPVYGITIEDFYSAIKSVVVRKLKDDNSLRNELDRKFGAGIRYVDEPPASGAWYLRFEAVVHSRLDENIFIRLAEDHPYIKRIYDFAHFFQDPDTIIGREVKISIGVLLARRQEPLHGTEDLQLADMVHGYKSLEPVQSYECLGKIRNDQRRASERITVRHVLLGMVDDDDKRVDGLYHLPAWNLDERLISQTSLSNVTKVAFDRNYRWLPKYRDIPNEQQLERAIFQGPQNLDIPFEPGMSLVKHDANRDPPFGAQLPLGVSIAAIVRILNHVESFDHLNNTLENLNCQIEIRSADETVEEIAEKIRSMMGRKHDLANDLLIKEPEQWKDEIWAIPHRYPGEEYLPNLVRYLEGPYSQFLFQSRVDAGETKMYMEYHIWPAEETYLRSL